MTAMAYIHRVRREFRLNSDYETIGSKYKHVVIWNDHHQVYVDPRVYIRHHKDHNKRNNRVCDRKAPCPDLSCGNLGLMTRADHIREHRPGRMGGRKIPNKAGKQEAPRCVRCGAKKGSRNGSLCRACYTGS